MVGFILTIVRSMLIMLPELTAEREWWGEMIRSVAVNSGSIINIDLTIVSMKPTIKERVVGRED
jgi:hypothetical protein